jgi:hypothetical protein
VFPNLRRKFSARQFESRTARCVSYCFDLTASSAGWSDEEREAKRQELRAVLTAVVCEPDGEVYYYQGLNDIASVLLFVAGERDAFTMLKCMARCQLRDCTRSSLDAVLELLHLLLPLLKVVGHISALF